jgi:uncharacterized protein YjbI with pentapeptide repeats
LTAANLKDAIMVGADLENCLLAGANLSGATLDQAKFKNAKLNSYTIDGDKNEWVADMFKTKKPGIIKLAAATLMGASIKGTVFMKANLSGITWVDGRICVGGSMGECRFEKNTARKKGAAKEPVTP